jgi:general secretion pathway protein A
MYLSFYGLGEKPFSITPDPRYLYLGGRHAEALAHLLYGVTEAGGFIQLTGEVGTGKTTMIRSLLARRPDNTEIALVINPSMDVGEFLLTLCEELGILMPDEAVGSVKDQIDILNRHLLRAHAQGKRVVLIIDEAQTLSREVLEQVRLLTNLETETQKLLQIILIGQPELREMLARNDLRQLAQRITGRYHLDPLSREETAAYVRHRLRIAGATQEIFTRGALAELHRQSGGIPRLINIIGDRALLGGYTEDRHQLGAAHVRRAAGEVFGRRVQPAWLPWTAAIATAALVSLCTWLVWAKMSDPRPDIDIASSTAPAEANIEAAPAPAEPAAAAPPPELAQVLQDEGEPAAAEGAWQRLFGLWNVQYTSGSETACVQALRQGLECLELQGDLAELRRFNRPAILTLRDDAGALHDAVVAQLHDDQRLRLLIGEGSYDIDPEDLEQRWDGRFVLLWKPAQLDTRNLALGMWGETVRNLRIRLNAWAGRRGEPLLLPDDPDFFDEELELRVMDFQQRHGLVVDGIAGARTQAVLDAMVPGPDTPLLTAAAVQ